MRKLTISSEHIIMLAFFVLSQVAFAQEHLPFVKKDRNSKEIYLKSGAVLPQEVSGKTGVLQFTKSSLSNGKHALYLQFDKLPDAEIKNQMLARGIEILDYVPNKSFLALASSNIGYEDLKSWSVTGIVEQSAQHKQDAFLAYNLVPDFARNGSDYKIMAHIFPGIQKSFVANKVSQISGAEVISSELLPELIWINIAPSSLNELASIPEIKFIEIAPEEGQPENSTARTLHRSNSINTNYSNGLKYDGTGVVMQMQDDGDIGPHIDFEGRVDQTQANVNTGFGNHGDHVAGTFMGAGNLDPLAEGMAPGVFGLIHGSSNIHYNNVPLLVQGQGLVITTKSYSNGCNAGYTTLTQTLDGQVVNFPSLIHVFSAGNAGGSDCGYGAGNGWGNVTGGHKIGKNVIAVANLDYADGLSGSSSRGPAADGRIKPDISAKGSNVYSCDEDYDYRTISGTSMACPGVSGVMAQLYEAYRDLNGGQDPNSALMKAVVLNTAEDLGNRGPDFRHGWGRINALQAYRALENQDYTDSVVSNLQTNTHTLNIPAGTARLRIMLYWKDPEASPSSTFALVNDLDLQVVAPGLNSFSPYILNPAPNATTLDLPATNGIDDLNNMEQVEIDNPVAGNYTITVSGAQVPQGPQQYYIVYQLADDSVELTYPIGGEPLVPGETASIRWDAVGDTGPFTLEYTTDNGVNWNVIAANVSQAVRYYDWQIPSTVSGEAMVRVSRGSSQSMSHAPFSIIGVPAGLNVQWACTDSLMLAFDSVSGASTYEISMLGAEYMDSIGTTSDNYFIVRNVSSANEYWFSVKARNDSQNIIGRRAYAVRKTPGTFACPVPNDVALARINSPLSGGIPDCQELDSVPIVVTVENRGTTVEGNFPIFIELNNGTTVSHQYTGSLQPFESAVVNTNHFADMSTGNAHIFKMWTDLTNDSQRTNDTSTSTVSTYSGILTSMPFNEDFDAFPLCNTTPNCDATSCSVVNGWTNEINNFRDDIDWRVWNSTTPSNGTGPSADHTGSNGNYLYLEASGNPVCSDKTAILTSPCVDLRFAQQPEFTFWYHMNGADMGELHVDVLSDGQWIEDVALISGSQGNQWNQQIVDFSAYNGKIINIRFRGITGADWSSDIAIDDISIMDNFQYALDAGISAVVDPAFSVREDCQIGDSVEISVSVVNSGLNPVGNMLMSFSINNGPIISEVFNTILASGDIDTFTFSQRAPISGVGNYDFKIWQSYGPDQNQGNDTIRKTIDIIPGTLYSIPYNQNFDNFANCGTANNCGGTVCNLPSGWKNFTNGLDDDIDWRTHNGPTASNGTGPSVDQNTNSASGKYLYLEVSNGCNNQVAILESPCFDLSNSFAPELSFWYHMEGADIGELHVDVFVGDLWIEDYLPPLIGAQGSTWQEVTLDLTLFAGSTFSFRIRGISGLDWQGDIAIDNITVSETVSSAVAGFTFTQPTCAGDPVVFTDNSTGSGLNYNWDFGPNALPNSATGIGPHTVLYNNSGVENVSLTVSNVAGSDNLSQSILIDDTPSVNFAWNNVGNDTVEFLNQTSNALDFVWDFGDGNSSTDLQPTHVYASPGVYTVTLDAENVCGISTITKTVSVGVNAVHNNTEFGSVLVYPNPNDGLINIDLSGISESMNIEASLMDVRGVIVRDIGTIHSNSKLTLDVSDLAGGIYLLRLWNESSHQIIKIEKR